MHNLKKTFLALLVVTIISIPTYTFAQVTLTSAERAEKLEQIKIGVLQIQALLLQMIKDGYFDKNNNNSSNNNNSTNNTDGNVARDILVEIRSSTNMSITITTNNGRSETRRLPSEFINAVIDEEFDGDSRAYDAYVDGYVRQIRGGSIPGDLPTLVSELFGIPSGAEGLMRFSVDSYR